MKRLLRNAALVATCAALLPAASAAAAPRYAAPTGSGPEPCTSMAPCNIDTAVESAHSGDEVIVAPGDYAPAGGTTTADCPSTSMPEGALKVPTGVTVHGVDGEPAPVISSPAGICITISGAGSNLSHLHVESAYIGFFVGGNADLNRIYAHATNTQPPVELSLGAVLRNSIAVAPSTGLLAVLTTGGDTHLHNVTAVGVVQTNSQVQPSSITATNVIATSGFRAGDTGQMTTSITFDHSIGSCQENGLHATCSGGAGNQPSATANFFDAANKDYHERSPSPSIDAGIADSVSGSVDFDGGPRANGTTDIGADEYGSPAPAVTTGAATDVTQTSATVAGTVNPGGQPTGAFFEYGPTSSFGAQTPASDVGGDFGDHPVSATLVGLAPGTTYYYRLASTVAGSRGEVGSFTTLRPPPGGGDGGGSTPTPTLTHGTPQAAVQHGASVIVDTGDKIACAAGGPACQVKTTGKATVPASALRVVAKKKTKRVTIVSAVTTVKAGTTKRIKVKLNRRGRKLLRKLKKLKATFTVTARAGTGKPVVRVHSLTMRQPKLPKKH